MAGEIFAHADADGDDFLTQDEAMKALKGAVEAGEMTEEEAMHWAGFMEGVDKRNEVDDGGVSRMEVTEALFEGSMDKMHEPEGGHGDHDGGDGTHGGRGGGEGPQ